jgi:hypothetical protein
MAPNRADDISEPARNHEALRIHHPALAQRLGAQRVTGSCLRAPDPRHPDLVVFGFGTGQTIGRTLAEAAPTAQITLVLVDPRQFEQILLQRDLTPLLQDPRLSIVSGSLREITNQLRLDRSPAQIELDPEAASAIEAELTPLWEMATELQALQASRAAQWPFVLHNTARNLERILSAASATSLSQLCAGRDVLIVAPGPSLQFDLPERWPSTRPWIVALDTAWRVLAARGLELDLCVTLDPTPGNRQKFACQDPAVPLVFFDGARPEPVARAECVLHACEAGGVLDRSDPWFGQSGRFASDGSVLLGALDLMLRCNARRIGLMGSDLALHDGQLHAASGAEPIDSPLSVISKSGEQIATTRSLWRHRRRLLRRIQPEPAGRVVDLASRGALLPDLRRESLAEFCSLTASLGKQPLSLRAQIESGAWVDRRGPAPERARNAALARLLEEARRVACQIEQHEQVR